MSLDLAILASGSSGNCSILRTPGGAVLIDAGLGPRTMAKRINGLGISLSDVRAICATHLDSDHFNPNWMNFIQKNNVRLFVHESRRPRIERYMADFGAVIDLATFDGVPFTPIADVSFTPIHLAHDEHGSHGFFIEGFNCKIGYATDLGRVPTKLIESFCGVDLIALESNYDPKMQANSGRPWFLQQRIMGGKGHLSNEQAYDAIRAILDRCAKRCLQLPQHIVLLHRSRQCNCPNKVRDLFESDRRIAPRLVLAEQHESTRWLSIRDRTPYVGEQMFMFG